MATSAKKPTKKKAEASKTSKSTKSTKVTKAKKTTTAKKPKSSKALKQGPFGLPPYTEKRGEEYMNNNQIEYFRMLLNTWKRQLMEEVDRTVHHMQDDTSVFPDPLDRATQEDAFNLELRTRDRERKLIKKIDDALERIEQGEYGYCVDCGSDIGIHRLEARPTADQCIDCKTFDEIREKQTSG